MLRSTVVFTGLTGLPGYWNFYTAGTTDAHAIEVGDRIGAFLTVLGDVFQEELIWTLQADVSVVDPADGAITAIVSNGGDAGSGNEPGEPLPLSTQLLVRLRTDTLRNNRRVQGRFNLPGISSGVNDQGRPAAFVPVNLQPAVDALIAAGDADTRALVWSRPTPTEPGLQAQVIQGSVWDQWAVLRSRRD